MVFKGRGRKTCSEKVLMMVGVTFVRRKLQRMSFHKKAVCIIRVARFKVKCIYQHLVFG